MGAKEAEDLLVLPKNNTGFTTTFSKTIVTNSAQYAKQIEATADLQASGWSANVKANLGTSKQCSGQSSEIVFSCFVYLQSQIPTMLQGCPKLTDPAKAVLKEHGADEFEKQYGTHFVYGFRATASALGEVKIKVESSEQGQSIAADLTASWNGVAASADGSASFEQKLNQKYGRSERRTNFKATGVSDVPTSPSIEDMSKF